ncbi:MAG: mannose-1-phosphate guanylyltransferase [Candidatus Omnitrophica bacterium]|nr:mannose-1-phosphate guanylyltransferase [Candidatus Omnitrophota bacterium]
MKKHQAKAVIMAGGQGERFWPLTHKEFPKYRIRLDNRESLLQKTYRRLLKIYSVRDIHVVTTRDHVRFIREELPFLDRARLIVEPERRNTAPAIFLSVSLLARDFGEEAVVSFFPADHLIKDERIFKDTLKRAVLLARKGERLVTVGIEPTFAATGYGYIQTGSPVQGVPGACEAARFVEKPSRRKALGYLKKGNFLWNGGIFTWRAGVFLRAMKTWAPQIGEGLDLGSPAEGYGRLPKISIDCALLEKARNIAVIRSGMDWCDMGSWDMFLQKSMHGHFASGPSHHRRSRDSLLLNYRKAPLVTLGVSDLIVVHTDRGTLICKRGFSEEAARMAEVS